MADPRILHLQRAEIDLLPGSGADLRWAAESLRATLPALESAADAATRLGDLLAGEMWRGPAWSAFAGLVARKPLRRASEAARDAMSEAAAHLDQLASTHDRHQDELRWIRSRWATLTAGQIEEEHVAELGYLEERAHAIHEAQATAETQVATVFDRLDDEPTFAEPPDSLVGQVRGGAGSFAGGLYDAWRESLPLMMIMNPMTVAPYMMHKHRDDPDFVVHKAEEVGDAVDYAVENPWDFTKEFGRQMIDWDTFQEDKWRWLGRMTPDLVITAATWGGGSAAKGGLNAVDAAEDAADVAAGARAASRTGGAIPRIPDDVKEAIDRASTAADAVDTADTVVAVGADGADEDC